MVMYSSQSNGVSPKISQVAEAARLLSVNSMNMLAVVPPASRETVGVSLITTITVPGGTGKSEGGRGGQHTHASMITTTSLYIHSSSVCKVSNDDK